MDYSRRAMLSAMGGLVVGGSLAAMSGNVIAAPAAPAMSAGKDGHFGQMGGEFGWTPKKIDDIAEKVMKIINSTDDEISIIFTGRLRN